MARRGTTKADVYCPHCAVPVDVSRGLDCLCHVCGYTFSIYTMNQGHLSDLPEGKEWGEEGPSS